MSPLRQHMIAVLQLSGQGERTQEAYVREGRLRYTFYRTSPKHLSEEAWQTYFLHRKNVDHLAPNSMRICSSGIRCFFQHVLKRAWHTLSLLRAQTEPRLPAVLSLQEVRRLLKAATPLHHQVYFPTVSSLGLIPSEYSSGEQRRQGSITKAGNTHARRVLVEGAWAYRSPAKVSRHWPLRLEKQPKVIQDISWKAQGRLCKRYRRLVSRGKHANVVTVAIARELTGCMWAIAREVPVTPYDYKRKRIQSSTRKGSKGHRKRRSPGVVSPSAAL